MYTLCLTSQQSLIVPTSLTDCEINKIVQFIKENYQDVYLTWAKYSEKGYYEK